MARVAHLSSVHRPTDVRIVKKQCASLAKVGHEVAFIVPTDEGRHEQGVRILAVPQPRNRLWRILFTTFRVWRTASSLKPDIYHIHDPELLVGGFLFHLLGRKVVYDMHESLPRQISHKDWIRGALVKRSLRELIARAERIVLRRLPVVFAEHSYANEYPWVNNAVVVLNLPPKELAYGEIPEKGGGAVLGYFGCISSHRGSLTTLEAVRLLQEEGLPTRLNFVGSAGEAHLQELHSFVRTHNLKGVVFHGYQPLKEGLEIISRCHIGLAVLKPIPNFVESYPTKLFEYMALGIPVITSNFPLYKEVVEGVGCGLCIDPGDPGQLADAVKTVLGNPEEASLMGKRGREAVASRYNWSSEEEKLLGFYESVLRQACPVQV